LLPRAKRRALASWYTIQLRKLRYFYGFYKGYKGVFFKRLHRLIKKYPLNRVSRISSLLELRLDIVLVRLGLFKNVKFSRRYIKKFGVFIGDKRVRNVQYVLKIGDILSFNKNHRAFFKLKLLLKLKPSLNLIQALVGRLSLENFPKNLDFLNLDLSLVTCYVRLLFTNFPAVGRDLSLRSIFFISYFPRFLEANFSTFEFVCCSKIDPLVDIKYPFRVKPTESKRLLESIF